MNYHIFPQDKFFNSYIEDIYSLNLESENIFWILGEKGDTPMFSTIRNVEYIGNDKTLIVERLKDIGKADSLFVSWYCGVIAEAIIESSITCKLYVYIMGGEFYADPLLYHAKWLYDRLTYKCLQKKQVIPSIKLTRKNPLHWYRCLKDVQLMRASKRQIKKEFEEKQKHIERIDYLVAPRQGGVEVNLLKKLYPTMHATHVFGMFDQNFDLAASFQYREPHCLGSLNILVGNSADPTNNHADVYGFIRQQVGGTHNIYSILSYGDEIGKEIAEMFGKKYFGKNFFPIEYFMNRTQYLSFLNSMDIVVMFHNRQQAVGNIISSLVLGKPVFIKSTNVLYTFFKEIGIRTVYDVSLLSNTNVIDCIKESRQQKKDTIDKIRTVFSKEERLKCLKELLTK